MNIIDIYLGYFPPGVADILAQTLHSFAVTGPYWGPVLIFMFSIDMWKRYVRAYYLSTVEWVIIEIKLPPELSKSPQAMEVMFSMFHQTSDKKWYDRWWKGYVRTWFSLELVSLEGHVHFFIRMERRFLKAILPYIYSQFPNVQISEVEDYVNFVNYRANSEWDIFGTEFLLTKPDPYPIKTYMDYGLDKDVRDDTTRVDPITPVIEYLGSIGKDEQIWIQILIMASKPRYKVKGKWFKKQTWHDEGTALVKKLREAEKTPGQEGVILYMRNKMLSPGEEQIVKSIERGIGKLGFDCGIRSIYLAKKNAFDGARKPGLVHSFRQYNTTDMNGFRPNRTTDFDYPWQDFKNIRLNLKKHFMFRAYKARSYFYQPYVRKPFALSTEELATIYHFPGAVSETPTFHRVPSKTGKAPSNLPRE